MEFIKKLTLVLVILLVLNIFAEIPTGADLLIICPDAYEDEFADFAEWKTKKGILTRIATLSETGSSTSNIDDYIENAYSTWDPAPKYVILGSNTNSINMVYAGNTSYGSCYSDWEYGDVSGDLYQEILIGRFPAADEADITNICNKVLSYERTPASGDWLAKATCATRYDGDESDADYSANMDTLQTAMIADGITYIDDYANNVVDGTDVVGDANDVEAAVNAGRSFLAYRGQGTTNWWSPFQINPNDMNNTNHYFVTLGITCHTVYDGTGTSTELGESIMQRTNAGAVAYYGTTSTISHGSHLRGEVFEGFSRSFFADTTNDLGRAAEAGRRHVWEVYADEVQNKSHVLHGDPEMDIRSVEAMTMTVDHPATAFVGESNTILVNCGIANALICIKLEEDVYMRGNANAFGSKSFTFTPSITGDMSVTVTAKNYIPYEGTISIIPNGPFPVYSASNIDDLIRGNNDTRLNPGENVNLFITLNNEGTSEISSVNATLSTSDPYVTVTTANASFPNIPVASSRESTTGFGLEIASSCPKGHIVDFELNVTDGSSHSWDLSNPSLEIHQPNIVYVAHIVNDAAPLGDGDGILEAGESAKIEVTMQNEGLTSLNATDLNAVPLDVNLDFDDALTQYLQWTAGVSKDNDSDPFCASLAPFPVAVDEVSFDILIEGDGLTYTFYDTLTVNIEVAGSGSSTYTGPDSYGYYCYDNTDTETGQAPTYDWNDISGVGGRYHTLSTSDDAISTFYIPFTFQYYGETSNQISVCTNGFVTIGEETWSGGYPAGHEAHMPGTGEANAILAGFWDDLDPSRGGDIYGYNDATNHVYVVQYDEVTHYDSDDLPETYQIIIHDPAYWDSPTDDGDVIFQYHTVTDMLYQATGIENFEGTVGIEYVYRSDYDENAEEIVPGRAIRFTTNPPISEDPWVVVDAMFITDYTPYGDGNLAAEEGETISMYVTLRNQGTTSANNTQATISCSDPFISISDDVYSYGNIAVDGTAINGGDPYTFSISGLSSPDYANFEMDITCNSGAYNRTTILQVPVWVVLGVDENILPDEIEMSYAYPNPFNSTAHIDFELSESGFVRIDIFDVSGKVIKSIAKYYQEGENMLELRFDDQESGVYLYRIQTDDSVQNGKMILMK